MHILADRLAIAQALAIAVPAPTGPFLPGEAAFSAVWLLAARLRKRCKNARQRGRAVRKSCRRNLGRSEAARVAPE